MREFFPNKIKKVERKECVISDRFPAFVLTPIQETDVAQIRKSTTRIRNIKGSEYFEWITMCLLFNTVILVFFIAIFSCFYKNEIYTLFATIDAGLSYLATSLLITVLGAWLFWVTLGKKVIIQEIDRETNMLEMVLACVKYPNLNDIDLQQAWGVTNACELIKKMLLPGEYAALSSAVSELLGFDYSPYKFYKVNLNTELQDK